jgi:hypothetical protein
VAARTPSSPDGGDDFDPTDLETVADVEDLEAGPLDAVLGDDDLGDVDDELAAGLADDDDLADDDLVDDDLADDDLTAGLDDDLADDDLEVEVEELEDEDDDEPDDDDLDTVPGEPAGDGAEVTALALDPAFEEEDEDLAAVVVGDEDEDDDVDGIRDGEFVCRSCFLAKRDTQLADPERMLCRDCA